MKNELTLNRVPGIDDTVAGLRFAAILIGTVLTIFSLAVLACNSDHLQMVLQPCCWAIGIGISLLLTKFLFLKSDRCRKELERANKEQLEQSNVTIRETWFTVTELYQHVLVDSAGAVRARTTKWTASFSDGVMPYEAQLISGLEDAHSERGLNFDGSAKLLINFPKACYKEKCVRDDWVNDHSIFGSEPVTGEYYLEFNSTQGFRLKENTAA